MPMNRLKIRKETRMLGAIQMMTGLICNCLGMIWTYLLITQITAFGKTYIPVAALVGYPYWSSGVFLFSGFFTILFERTRSRLLKSGRLLSWYLFLFTILELIVSCTVTHWLYRAKYTGQ
uniref:Membrane spanning 4-domains A13 n=1 Tax=Molossus molossus TaxID=27622 RepID=A0A7J8ESH4_MOLMO|nr:hypothetical protein HJG59_012515 [Molossus molossus]